MDSNQSDEGIYIADNLVQTVSDQDESSNAIQKLQGKKSIKTIVGRNTLPNNSWKEYFTHSKLYIS